MALTKVHMDPPRNRPQNVTVIGGTKSIEPGIVDARTGMPEVGLRETDLLSHWVSGGIRYSSTMTSERPFPPPRRVLWEITWKCDLRCAHCLVSAGQPRGTELSTEQAFEVVDQIAELGARVVSLTGGEPLLRRDWFQIASRIRERQLGLRFSSNGHLLTENVLKKLVTLGVDMFTVSIDGTESTHNRLRPFPARRSAINSHARVLKAIDRIKTTDIEAHVITSVGKENLNELPEIHETLKRHNVDKWILQLVHPTGRAGVPGKTRASWHPLDPGDLLQLSAFIESRAPDRQLQPTAFNSIGYMGKKEPILRKSGKTSRNPIWQGCTCGVDVMGIEPDGGIKGCANQVGDPFVVGNVATELLHEIWRDRRRWHWLNPSRERLAGACATCSFADICQGGCTTIAYRSTGELFNNPYCIREIERSSR